MEQGYILYYKDDFHKKHITFIKNYKSISFYQERFGKENVKIDPRITQIPVPMSDKYIYEG